MYIPTEADNYYSVAIDTKIEVEIHYWDDNIRDIERLRSGNVFESKEEAESVAQKIREIFKASK